MSIFSNTKKALKYKEKRHFLFSLKMAISLANFQYNLVKNSSDQMFGFRPSSLGITGKMHVFPKVIGKKILVLIALFAFLWERTKKWEIHTEVSKSTSYTDKKGFNSEWPMSFLEVIPTSNCSVLAVSPFFNWFDIFISHRRGFTITSNLKIFLLVLNPISMFLCSSPLKVCSISGCFALKTLLVASVKGPVWPNVSKWYLQKLMSCSIVPSLIKLNFKKMKNLFI